MFRYSLLYSTNIGSLFLLDRQQEISNSQFPELVKLGCYSLQRAGLRKNAKVVLCLPNSLEFCIYLFSAWNLGACVIPISSQSTPAEILHIIKTVEPQLVIWPDGREEFFSNFSFAQDDEALILFTSGSSGLPKGVILTDSSLQMKIITYTRYISLSELDITLCLLPLSFGHGLINNFLFPFLSGKKVVLGKSDIPNSTRFGEIIDDHQVTAFSSVPALLKVVVNYSTPPQKKSLRRGFCASAPLSEELWQQTFVWSGGIGLKNMFGMTELAAWALGPTKDVADCSSQGVGTPWDAEVKIEQDELWIKAPYVMKGYYNNPQLTESVMQDGWLRTGDLASIDELGKVHLQGRLDSIINLGGLKVSPEEINLVLRTHPSIQDSYTLGLPQGGIGSVLVPRSGHTIQLSEILKHSKEQLAPYKIPNKFRIVDTLPMNDRGKINKDLIKKLFFS